MQFAWYYYYVLKNEVVTIYNLLLIWLIIFIITYIINYNILIIFALRRMWKHLTEINNVQ